ncbi:MAG: PEP-CTERM/exosortase system-associated acyltransferase [Alphaproteobacteria bacterium]|nr:PEP-CTERM/exosortase system-associated acyltransferase [Alphaproteobacteria bacterium]
MRMTKSLIKACTDTLMSNLKRNLQEHSYEAVYNKTFELVPADNDELRGRCFRLRHKVLCEENGYECPTDPANFIESDEYDDRARHFMLKHRVSHEVVGTLRVILPNDEAPGESFPMQELCDHPLLKFDSRALHLCEISRFVMAPRFRKRASDGKFLSAYSEQDVVQIQDSGKTKQIRRQIPYAQAALLQGAFEAAMQAQILDCVWMVEPLHLPSLQKIGFAYRVLGPQVKSHGGLQPLIFNIKHVLDTMRHEAPHCWTIISDNGRLQNMADMLAQNHWQDGLIDQACKDMIYQKLLS